MARTLKKILVVEQGPMFADILRKMLEGSYDVYYAENRIDADQMVMQGRFAVVIIDYNLNDRLDGQDAIFLARRYYDLDPKMVVILMNEFSGTVPNIDKIDAFIIKGMFREQYLAMLRNAIYWKNLRYITRREIFNLFHTFPPESEYAISDVIREISSSPKGVVEMMTGRLHDDYWSKWNAYKLEGVHKKNMVTLGLASSVGCGRCGFCAHGYEKFIRNLTISEMLAQVRHGIRCHLAQGLFQKKLVELWVSFTCCGDAIATNLDNACQTISFLGNLAGLFMKFIVATTGPIKNLRRFVDYFADPLRRSFSPRLYVSVHTLDIALRNYIMRPVDILKQRDILQQYAEITGAPVTISVMGMHSWNLDLANSKAFARVYGNGRPFELKVQGIAGDHVDDILKPPSKELRSFIEFSKNEGLVIREREIAATNKRGGCGTTSAYELPAKKLFSLRDFKREGPICFYGE